MLKGTVVTILVGAVGYFLTKMYHARMLFVERKILGMASNPKTSPQSMNADYYKKPLAPGHSFFFSHVLFFKTVMEALPINARCLSGHFTR